MRYYHPGENPKIYFTDKKSDPRDIPKLEYLVTEFNFRESYSFYKSRPSNS